MLALTRTLRFIAAHELTRRHPWRALGRLATWQLRCRLAPAGIVVPFVGGTRLLVRRGMTGATGNIYCGLHEFADMAFVLHLLRPADLFVDIGANVGSYSILAAGACGASVVAFEPLPRTCAALLDNVRLNGLEARLAVINAGVGGEAGELAFSTGLDTVNHVLSPLERDVVESVKVPVLRLDDALAGRTATVIKIDVEGFESEVVRGGATALAAPQLLAVLMELDGSGARYGFDERLLHQSMLERGFSACRYSPMSRKLEVLAGKSAYRGNTLYVRNLQQVRSRLREARRCTVLGVEF